jgi:hypothetical protein
MFRIIFASLVLLSLSACGGVLAYDRNGKVFAGPLDDMNIQVMNSSKEIRSKGSFDEIKYALNKRGTLVGVCRTTRTDSGRGMDFAVYNLIGREIVSASQASLARKMDNYLSSIGGNRFFREKISHGSHFYCEDIGASTEDLELVLYVRLLNPGTGEDTFFQAVRVTVGGGKLRVVDLENFHHSGLPQSVVALTNPLKGYTVDTMGGNIRIDGVPIELRGNSVAADSVKHWFE